MIIGVTHSEDGTPKTRLAISAKVSIGLPGEGQNGHPKKLDHFFIAGKNSKGEWVEHKDLTHHLRERYSPMVEDKRAPLREFDVVLLSDDIEEVFQTEFAWWSKSEKRCSGDGRTASRSTAIVSDELKKQHTGARRIPWQPCGERCPDLAERRCKPSGMLLFMFADRPVIGSVAAYFTTSYTTVMQIHSSLRQIQSLTGGRLRGIRLKMVLRPGKTRYRDASGGLKTGSAFFVTLEFRQADHTRLLSEMVRQTQAYLTAAPEGHDPVYTATVGEEPIEVELTEQEQAEIMQPEFYPADTVGDDLPVDDAPAGAPEAKPATSAPASLRDRIAGPAEPKAPAAKPSAPAEDLI